MCVMLSEVDDKCEVLLLIESLCPFKIGMLKSNPQCDTIWMWGSLGGDWVMRI